MIHCLGMADIRKVIKFMLMVLLSIWIGTLGILALLLLNVILDKNLARGDDVSSAVNAATRAFMVQSGAQSGLVRTGEYVNHLAERRLSKPVVDSVLGATTIVYRKKIESGFFKSPFVPFASQSISVVPNTVHLVTRWVF